MKNRDLQFSSISVNNWKKRFNITRVNNWNQTIQKTKSSQLNPTIKQFNFKSKLSWILTEILTNSRFSVIVAIIGFQPISSSWFARLCTYHFRCQTFTTRRVSFQEKMMFAPWVVVLHTSTLQNNSAILQCKWYVYLHLLSLSYTCDVYGFTLYHVSMWIQNSVRMTFQWLGYIPV